MEFELLEQIAGKQNASYLSDLRLDPGRKWEALRMMCGFPDKDQFSLEEWDEAASYLLGFEVHFESYEMIGKNLGRFFQESGVKQ